jgi:hypothetical protein
MIVFMGIPHRFKKIIVCPAHDEARTVGRAKENAAGAGRGRRKLTRGDANDAVDQARW